MKHYHTDKYLFKLDDVLDKSYVPNEMSMPILHLINDNLHRSLEI